MLLKNFNKMKAPLVGDTRRFLNQLWVNNNDLTTLQLKFYYSNMSVM